MTAQIERALNAECMWRSRSLPVVLLPIPNDFWIPARTPEERRLVARIIAKMKADGKLEPGAPDFVALWQGGGGMLEGKRPKTSDLFGTKPAGRPSDDQREMEKRAKARGILHSYYSSWDEMRDRLREWGAL